MMDILWFALDTVESSQIFDKICVSRTLWVMRSFGCTCRFLRLESTGLSEYGLCNQWCLLEEVKQEHVCVLRLSIKRHACTCVYTTKRREQPETSVWWWWKTIDSYNDKCCSRVHEALVYEYMYGWTGQCLVCIDRCIHNWIALWCRLWNNIWTHICWVVRAA